MLFEAWTVSTLEIAEVKKVRAAPICVRVRLTERGDADDCVHSVD